MSNNLGSKMQNMVKQFQNNAEIDLSQVKINESEKMKKEEAEELLNMVKTVNIDSLNSDQAELTKIDDAIKKKSYLKQKAFVDKLREINGVKTLNNNTLKTNKKDTVIMAKKEIESEVISPKPIIDFSKLKRKEDIEIIDSNKPNTKTIPKNKEDDNIEIIENNKKVIVNNYNDDDIEIIDVNK